MNIERFMSKIRLFIYFLLILLGIYIIYHFSVITYGLEQAKGQLSIIWDTKKIDELKNDPNLPDSLIAQFKLIDAIRAFAEDTLGLNVGDNYTSFYDQKGKPILWSVTASPEFEIKAYQWHFPIAGSFPYKGFFDYQKALEEERKLKEAGYDTEIDEVSAWSTLGILDDPILSSMLQRSAGKLAELIIHESTHATIYLKDQGQFNENRASFIGRQGADLFLSSHFGKLSIERKSYFDRIKKGAIFKAYMQEAIYELQQKYEYLDPKLSIAKKRSLKVQWINELKKGLKAENYFENDSIANLRLANFNPNNAFFSGFSTYSNKQGRLELMLEKEFNGNLNLMIASIKTKGLSLFNE